MKNGQKKPADQQSNQPGGDSQDDANEALDLESDADNDADGDDDDDDEDDNSSGNGGGAGNQQQDVSALVTAGIQAAMPALMNGVTSEIDRRINSALGRQQRRNGNGGGQQQQQDQQQNDSQGGGTVGTDATVVRAARLSFREYLPGEIKLLSAEERKLANEYGANLINARAAQGFDDDDLVGREVAEATAKFLKGARELYSTRTKRLLEKKGALKDQGSGQSGNPGGGSTDTKTAAQNAHDRRVRMGLAVAPTQ
jgi:hypothetical protein